MIYIAAHQHFSALPKRCMARANAAHQLLLASPRRCMAWAEDAQHGQLQKMHCSTAAMVRITWRLHSGSHRSRYIGNSSTDMLCHSCCVMPFVLQQQEQSGQWKCRKHALIACMLRERLQKMRRRTSRLLTHARSSQPGRSELTVGGPGGNANIADCSAHYFMAQKETLRTLYTCLSLGPVNHAICSIAFM